MEIPGYRIERQIGQGGMARVYLAIQESLDRPVALKVLRGDFSHSPELSERFLNEARTVAALNHANIITIHDIGVAAGVHYLSMEYVEGGDLRARITTGMTPVEALRLLRDVGSALEHAHRAGVVHRDVKPANILFRTDGTPLLTDFGIAKNLQTDEDLTLTGALIGSPNYLSPEQAQGIKVDGRSDIYSLGIIFYNMLVGEKPYEAESPMATIYMHIHEPLPKLPQPLRMYQPLLDRMTAKQPRDRFEDTGRLLSTVDATIGSIADPDPAGSRRRRRSTAAVRKLPADPNSAARGKPGAATSRWTRLALGAGVLVVVGVMVSASGVFVDRHSAQTASQPAAPEPGGDPARATTDAPSPPVPSEAEAEQAAGQSPPPESTETKVARLVSLGERALARNRLTVPRDQSAHYFFRQALALDPGHAGANRGLDRIAAAYLRLARRDFNAGRTRQAIRKVNLGLSVRPRAGELLGFKRQIERQIEIDRLLARARAALEDYRLTTPVGDNAHEHYRSVLRLDPHNPSAKRGLNEIARRYARLAEGLVAEYEYDKAQQYIARGLRVQPGNRRLLELREQAHIKNAPKQFIGDIKRFFRPE